MVYKTEVSALAKLGSIAENIMIKLNGLSKYKDKAAAYIRPQIKNTRKYVKKTANKVNKFYKKGSGKVHRSVRMVKLSKKLDIIKNIVVIAGAVIALCSLIVKFFADLND